MADIREWGKGILIFLFMTVMYYFFWNNIFLFILNFATLDMINSTSTVSSQVVGTMAWISFLILYLFTGPVYLVYSIVAGARNDVKTNPAELVKAVGAWTIITPIVVAIVSIISVIIESLEGVGVMTASENLLAGQMAWFIAFIALTLIMCVPTYFILKGYGQLGGEK